MSNDERREYHFFHFRHYIMTADFIRKTHMSHEITLEESGLNVFKFLYHVFSEQLNRVMSDFSVITQAISMIFSTKKSNCIATYLSSYKVNYERCSYYSTIFKS